MPSVPPSSFLLVVSPRFDEKLTLLDLVLHLVRFFIMAQLARTGTVLNLLLLHILQSY